MRYADHIKSLAAYTSSDESRGHLMKSPIEQEIIDGKYYWDKIGSNWYRLLERPGMEVIGHYRDWGTQGHWMATIRIIERNVRTERTKLCYTPEEARQWIEQDLKTKLEAND